MRRSEQIQEVYFRWMTRLVSDGRHGWEQLCRLLHEMEFTYILEMDENRAYDGCDLRYRFGDECGWASSEIEEELDNRPCSVLEMMVALANRCEEAIMDDPDSGDRRGEWFFGMVRSLGLEDMDDGCFDEEFVRAAVLRFLDRDYAPDGSGGLFTLRNPRCDMRRAEIWYQMMWHLDEVIYGRRERNG